MEKRYALDAERAEIERNVSVARDTLSGTGRPFSLDDPSLDQSNPSLQKMDNEESSTSNPTNGAQFHFIDDRPVVAGLNLAHKPRRNKKRHQRSDTTALDPMTDIKRRERILQKEKVAREEELQQEYTLRLKEFEMDF